MKVNLKLENANVDCNKNYEAAVKFYNELRQDKEDFTGWVNWPVNFPSELLDDMESVAKKISSICDTLIVIGIGGSYLGSAAVLEAAMANKKCDTELFFAGNDLSGEHLREALNVIKEKETCLCVVSKSGNTLETKISYSVLKAAMEEKYGEDASKRIVAISDKETGSLRQEINKYGYYNFEIPRNIGGRYSAFTPGIMFPLAVAGVDVREFLKGAKDIAADEDFWKTEGLKYALARFDLNSKGKDVEVFGFYEPSLRLLGEWCKQLFGESEGKEGKGLFPTSVTLTRDLHSMGQYLQQGKPVFFETIVNIKNVDDDVTLPKSAGEALEGRSLNSINLLAVDAVIKAHHNGGVDIIKIDLEDKKEYCLGQIMYYFMMTAGVTGKLMGIDPFNQPGVEDYKIEVKKSLGM